MEREGCPPPAKHAKLSRYGFQADGNTSTQAPEHGSMLVSLEDGNAMATIMHGLWYM